MNWFDDWGITLTVFIPVVGALIVMLLPRGEEELHKLVALVSSLAAFGRVEVIS